MVYICTYGFCYYGVGIGVVRGSNNLVEKWRGEERYAGGGLAVCGLEGRCGYLIYVLSYIIYCGPAGLIFSGRSEH